jgi:hypothetical protein
MTPDDQIPFVNGLIENVRKEIVQRIETRGIPETWDGIELRELIADYFDQCRHLTSKGNSDRAKGHQVRRRAYKNEVLIRGLL